MATWEEQSQDCLAAAKLLVQHGRLRSSISRAYYAAYCAIAGQLEHRSVSFAHGWGNPSHNQLQDLVEHNLPLRPDARRRIRRSMRLLRRAREDADYRPRAFIDRAMALDSIRLSRRVMETLGIPDEPIS